jgi:hypothetical protein
MNVSDAQRLKALEAANGKLKRLLANSMLELHARALDRSATKPVGSAEGLASSKR